jgi:glycosyltransferase involved in cell wall biosynthesis
LADPLVSIVLPTYNRVAFLPGALASISAQQLVDWELIVVDDGSTDDTRAALEKATAGLAQPITYLYQENQGSYAARNTGLARARGRYVAFFDSDDLWLPHHLQDCVAALEANADVDWVFAACRIVELPGGVERAADTFRIDGQPRPFRKLRTERRGPLFVIDDPGSVECQIRHGLYCGLQNSVMRPRVLAERRFRGSPRNEAEDQLLVIRALVAGIRLAYLDAVHVTYHLHGDNSSAAAQHGDLERRLRVYEGIARGFEELRGEGILNRAEQRALEHRLSVEYFWHMGYHVHWQQGRAARALACYWRGLQLTPGNLGYWKTFLLALARSPFLRAVR